MMGHKTGVAKRIQDLQPKGYVTHCRGHSLSPSVKDTTKNCKLLWTQRKRSFHSKVSLKRENLLGEIKENLEGHESEAKGIIGVCPQYQMDSTHKLFSANTGQLRSSSPGMDNFP